MNRSVSLRHQDAELNVEAVHTESVFLIRRWKKGWFGRRVQEDIVFYLDRRDTGSMALIFEEAHRRICENSE